MKYLLPLLFVPTLGFAWGGGPSPLPTDPVTYDRYQSDQAAFSYSLNTAIHNTQSTEAQMNAQQSQIDDLSSRLDKVDKMKALIEADIRLYDAKHYSVSVFNSYDAAHSSNFAAGVKIGFKVGQSYEERLIEKQQKQIDMLMEKLSK